MTTSTRHILQQLPVKHAKKALFLSRVMGDGIGDFCHLLDLIKHRDAILPDFEKDIIIESEHSDSETIDYFKKALEKQGIRTTIIDNPATFQAHYEHSSTPTAYIFIIKAGSNGSYVGWVRDHSHNTKLINEQYSAAIGVSTTAAIDYLNIPKLSVFEHSSIYRDENSINMNLYSGTESIFLNPADRTQPEEQLSRVLSKSENSPLKLALLGGDEKNVVVLDTAHCKQFLEKNLFVPCYFQHRDLKFIDFMNIVQESPLSAPFELTTFFVNKIRVDLLEQACNMGVISRNIKNMVIKTLTGTKEITNPNAHEGAKTVRFVTGYRINDDNDYDALFQCAQYFGGASGDKTLEKVLANGLIPLFIPHNGNKKDFIKDAAKRFPLFNALEYCFKRYADEDYIKILYDSDSSRPGISDVFLKNPSIEAKKFDADFFEKWKELCNELKEDYNLHRRLPQIVDDRLSAQIKEHECKRLLTRHPMNVEDIEQFLRNKDNASNANLMQKIKSLFYSALETGDLDAGSLQEKYNLIGIFSRYVDIGQVGAYITLAERILSKKSENSIEELQFANRCVTNAEELFKSTNDARNGVKDYLIELQTKINTKLAPVIKTADATSFAKEALLPSVKNVNKMIAKNLKNK